MLIILCKMNSLFYNILTNTRNYTLSTGSWIIVNRLYMGKRNERILQSETLHLKPDTSKSISFNKQVKQTIFFMANETPFYQAWSSLIPRGLPFYYECDAFIFYWIWVISTIVDQKNRFF